jgi:hypothetical protein
MPINFKKLKSQIHPFKPEVKRDYIFIANRQQTNNLIFIEFLSYMTDNIRFTYLPCPVYNQHFIRV